jgi:hypothetical protein
LAPSGSGKSGQVTYYPNVSVASGAVGVDIPSTKDDNAGLARGSKLLIGNLDDGAENELVVGDASALPSGVDKGGEVQIMRITAAANCSGTSAVRGPACIVQTLVEPSPNANDQFGRSMVITPFPDPTSATNILAVGAKDKLWVYFRAMASAKDPRTK